MEVKVRHSKFVVRKVIVGLDQPTNEALSRLVQGVKGLGTQGETGAIRYAIHSAAKILSASGEVPESAIQKTTQVDNEQPKQS